ncbi:MAG: DNA primase [Acidobacteriota bacterium]|nr:DNA primase [Acidobacteriota bacterium]
MSDLDINDNVLAELRAASDIVEVIGEHTRLKKAGRSWKGLCPFHNERTPSFTVDRDKGLYHCFGCGAGGDVIHFVRQIDRLDFPEAIETLAARFGVAIPKRVARGPRDVEREGLLGAVAAAQRFYAAELAKPGNLAAEYLEKRAVPEAVSRALGVGYAPAGWETLAKGLGGAWPEAVLVEAGLLQPRTEGRGSYDRFRNRLLFTIRDERGRPVGFSGRALSPEDEPKYLNSPESPIFLKKRLLYALTDARDAIRRGERSVLAEGCFDHLALYLAGVEETVASMGTALTPEQAAKLKRLAPKVVLCYDGDAAGRSAARGAIGLLLAQGLQGAVAPLPDGEDPDDVRRREGPDALRARIDQARDYLAWLEHELEPAASGLSPEEKKDKIRAILEILSAIPDRILRYEEYRRLSVAVGVPVEVLWAGQSPSGGAPGSRPGGSVRTAVGPAGESDSAHPRGPGAPGTQGNGSVLLDGEIPAAERRLLQWMIRGGEHISLIRSNLRAEHLTHPGVRGLLETFGKAQGPSGTVDFHRYLAHLREPSDVNLVSRLALEESPDPTEEEVLRLLKQLEKKYLKREHGAVVDAIRRAEQAEQPAEVSRLMERAKQIGKRIVELGR